MSVRILKHPLLPSKASGALTLTLTLAFSGGVPAQTPDSWPTSQALDAFSGEISDVVGIWAKDCSRQNGGEYVTVVNRTHALTLTDAGTGRAVSFSELQDSWLDQAEGEYRVADGVLYFQGIGQEPGNPPEEQIAGEQCRALPASTSLLHGEAASLLLAMPAVQAACADSPAVCADELMAVGDVADTGGLNEADLSRLIRIATYLGTADGDADSDQILGGQAASIGLAPILADMILRSFDYDADQQLSLDEMTADRSLLNAGSLNVAESSGNQLQQSLQQGMHRLEGLLRMLQ